MMGIEVDKDSDVLYFRLDETPNIESEKEGAVWRVS
uniref:Uncharacterized protein n=1 Tax=Candidatus Kentrum sp. DK TaxID=2126562 RepID=A0A450SM68_9GAMM|nr:MAG: hypothetical protein BECKDK2373B_GA0170837_104821 [Candidatus Kentron sp. DK]